MKDGKLQYCYNWFNRERYTIESLNRVPTGKTTLRFEFVYDGEGSAREGQRLST
jgi:arylsulfatase